MLRSGAGDMRVDRLRMLLRVGERVRMEDLPFDMMVWVGGKKSEVSHTCGSVGCMIGWGARDPEVMATGLHLCTLAEEDAAHERGMTDPDLSRDERDSLLDTSAGTPRFGSYSGLTAVQEWLECSAETARQLFLPVHYDTRHVAVEDVIARLRVVVDWHERQLVPGAES